MMNIAAQLSDELRAKSKSAAVEASWRQFAAYTALDAAARRAFWRTADVAIKRNIVRCKLISCQGDWMSEQYIDQIVADGDRRYGVC